jgi:hypothetical protein
MKHVKTIILITIIFGSIVLNKTSAQEINSPISAIKILSTDYSYYPKVSSNLLIYCGKEKKSNVLNFSNIDVFENLIKCKLDSIENQIPNLHIHILPDYSTLSRKELKDYFDFFSSFKLPNEPKYYCYGIDSSITSKSYKYIDSYFVDYQSFVISSKVLSQIIDNNEDTQIINVVFIITEDFKNSHYLSLNEFLNLSSNNTFCSVLYSGKNKSSKSEIKQIDENIVFINKISNRKSFEIFGNQLNVFLNSFYTIKFRCNPIFNLSNNFNYRFSINSDVLIDSIETQVNYPKYIIDFNYEKNVIDSIDELLSSKKFIEASEYLFEKMRTHDCDKFNKKSKKIIIEYSEWLKVQAVIDTTSLYDFAENHYTFSVDSNVWYKNIKLDILKILLSKTQKSDETIQHRYNLTKSLYYLDSQSMNNKLLFYDVSGDLASFESKYWDAVDQYFNYIDLENSNVVESKLNIVISKAFESDYKNHKYIDIYKYGNRLLPFINSFFELRYIYGNSCEKAKDYQLAIKEYRWLVSNWKENQNYIDWNELFNRLNNLYALTFQFDEAILLNKRIFKQTENEQELFLLLGNTRAKYLQLVSKIVKIYINNVGVSSCSSLLSDYNSMDFPHFLDGIYTVDRNRNILNKLYSKSVNLPLNVNSSKYPFIYTNIETQKSWIIDNIPSGKLLIIEFSIGSNQKEQLLLSSIKSKKQNVSSWNALSNHQKEIGMKFISQILTAAIQGELSKNKSGKINPYWSALKSSNLFNYIVHHDENGEISHMISFNRDNAEYANGMWEKSSIARAFFKQQINYKNRIIMDIVNPIYLNNRWSSALRIGVK